MGTPWTSSEATVLAAGVCERMGSRNSMEDATAVFCRLKSASEDNLDSIIGKSEDQSALEKTPSSKQLSAATAHRDGVLGLFGVFDGHGGAESAHFCSKAIPFLVARHGSLRANAELALYETFAEADRRLSVHLEERFRDDLAYNSGCTAVVVVITSNPNESLKITCANAGDSRAILVHKDGSYVSLSQDHSPQVEAEKMRIESAGGFLAPPPMRPPTASLRVLGSLAVTRSLGDFAFKLPKVAAWGTAERPITGDLVSSQPDFVVRQVRANGQLILLACDGIWDVFTRSVAARFARDSFASICKDPATRSKTFREKCDMVATQVVEEALRLGSKDNCSCVVVYIAPRQGSTLCSVS